MKKKSEKEGEREKEENGTYGDCESFPLYFMYNRNAGVRTFENNHLCTSNMYRDKCTNIYPETEHHWGALFIGRSFTWMYSLISAFIK